MKRIFLSIIAAALISLGATPLSGLALAAGLSVSGGGEKVAGQNFTVTVVASGAEFDSLQGTISVSGPVTIVSFGTGSATWLPGKAPGNGTNFVGITSPTSKLTVATITLKGTKEGKGSVTASNVKLARNGAYVGTSGGSTSFTIGRAPTPPGSVTVTSSSHPNPDDSYEANMVLLAWEPPANGSNGYGTAFDQVATTVPAEKVTTTDKTASHGPLAVGTYYFHIRPNNKDGWGPTTHFKVTVKPTTDATLATPAITSVSLTNDYQNDITQGTLTGVTFNGTGPIDYAIGLTFSPEIPLPAEKYPAPVVDAEGRWSLTITDPVKVGFYTLTAQGRKDSLVSPVSPKVAVEVTAGLGGTVRLITDADATETYKTAQAAEATRVASARSRQKTYLSVGTFLVLIGLGGGFIWLRRRFGLGAKI